MEGGKENEVEWRANCGCALEFRIQKQCLSFQTLRKLDNFSLFLHSLLCFYYGKSVEDLPLIHVKNRLSVTELVMAEL